MRWAAGTKVVAQLAGWIFTLLTIRLLEPADYGRMAMLMVVITFAALVTEFGFTASIIRDDKLNRKKISQIFGISIVFNLICFIIVFLSAPLFSYYFQNDITREMRVIAVSFLLAPWGRVYEAQLMRNLDFRRRSIVHEGAYMLGVMTTFALALLGYGLWSLIWGVLTAAGCRALGFMLLAPERHWPSWDFSGARSVITFGSGLTFQRMMSWLQSHVDVMVLGRLLDATALGHFNVARTLVAIPGNKLGQLLSQLPLAAFARLQHDRQSLRNALAESLCMLLRATLPLFALLSVTAPEVVALALGPTWLDIAPLMALFAVAMPLQLVHAVTLQALNALGMPLVGAAIMALLGLSTGLATGLSATFGLEAVAAAWTTTYILVSLVAITWTGRYTGLGLGGLTAAAWRPLACTALLLVAGLSARAILPPEWPAWLLLGGIAGTAGVMFLLATLLIDRRGLLRTIAFIRT